MHCFDGKQRLNNMTDAAHAIGVTAVLSRLRH
jgi:hypothetical protein